MKCRACGGEHPVHLRCEMFKSATVELGQVKLCEEAVTNLEPQIAAPIKQAEDFIKRVGRPKKYPDRKTQMREYMRKRRAK